MLFFHKRRFFPPAPSSLHPLHPDPLVGDRSFGGSSGWTQLEKVNQSDYNLVKACSIVTRASPSMLTGRSLGHPVLHNDHPVGSHAGTVLTDNFLNLSFKKRRDIETAFIYFFCTCVFNFIIFESDVTGAMLLSAAILCR